MYNSQKTTERIKEQAKKHNISINRLLLNCELGKNTITKMSNGTDILTQNFEKIAENLDCSIDYLLGRTDNPNVNLCSVDYLLGRTDNPISINIKILPGNKVFFIDSKIESVTNNITKRSSKKVINFINSGTVDHITIGESLEPIYTICTDTDKWIDIEQSSLVDVTKLSLKSEKRRFLECDDI